MRFNENDYLAAFPRDEVAAEKVTIKAPEKTGNVLEPEPEENAADPVTEDIEVEAAAETE